MGTLICKTVVDLVVNETFQTFQCEFYHLLRGVKIS